MPANDHLQWYDISDMTAGLWETAGTINRFAAPPNAFVTLDDYQPMKSGGLRPAVKAVSTSLSGGPGANEVPIGIFARNGVSRSVANGGTGLDSTDMVLVTMNTSDFKVRIYRRDGTVGSPSWSLRHTTAAAASAGHQITAFEYFKDSSNVEWYLMTITTTSSSISGLYTMRTDYATTSNTGNDGLVARIQAYSGPVCVSQARILVAGGNDEKINYSSVGLTTGFGSFLSVAPNRLLPNISIISGIEPSDLLIGKEGAPWVQISGDVTSTATPVREMGDQHHQRQNKQQVPRTPGGIAFIEGDGRVFQTDGRNFQSLSDQLAGHTLTWSEGMVGTGTMAFLNDILMVPGLNTETKGYVYDFTTGCWFRTTGINPVFSWADPYSGTIWCTNHSSSAPSVVSYNVFSGARVSSGLIQTVPFADKNGRNIDIREVQLFVQCVSASSFTVDLINQADSVVGTFTVSAVTDRQMVRFLFPQTKSEYLSVRITPSADNGSSAAPIIERIRVGFGVNNLIN